MATTQAVIVRKFGGTSMGTPESILNNVSQIIIESHDSKKQLCVVSAMSGVTGHILELIEKAVRQNQIDSAKIEMLSAKHKAVIAELKDAKVVAETKVALEQQFVQLDKLLSAICVIGERSTRAVDACIAIGEKLSAILLAAALTSKGVRSQAVFLDRLGVDGDTYDNDSYWDTLAGRIRESWDNASDVIPVFTGFIGFTPNGIISDVGRGYSDYCACLVGQAFTASSVEIWTDVDGVLTTNPKVCPQAKIIPSISYDEMAELASFGAKVLHPYSLRPACINNIPLVILNTFNVQSAGTQVVSERSAGAYAFKSIAYKNNVDMIRVTTPRMLLVHGFIEKLGKVLSRFEQSVDLISTSEVSVSMSLEQPPRSGLLEALSELGEVSVHTKRTVLSLVGEEIRQSKNILGKVFTCLEQEQIPVEMVSLGDLKLNLSIVIPDEFSDRAVQALHRSFFE